MENDETSELEPGSDCPDAGCAGTLDTAPTRNCSCHLDAPCSSCVSAGLLCDTCGWDSTPETDWDEEFSRRDAESRARWTAKKGARRDQWTHTKTDNPYNSTPFTNCCGIAAVDTDRCPHCEAEIRWHDDGLAARRREVGHGNCLMCGKKQNGKLGDPGVCCC